MEILIKRPRLKRNPQHICPHIVKRISDIWKQNRFFAVEKGHENHRQHIVRTNTCKYLAAFHSIIIRDRIHQHLTRRFRIQPQPVCVECLQRCHHTRCRWIWVLVRVQLDHIRPVRLFSRCIGLNGSNIFFPAAHHSSLFLSFLFMQMIFCCQLFKCL